MVGTYNFSYFEVNWHNLSQGFLFLFCHLIISISGAPARYQRQVRDNDQFIFHFSANPGDIFPGRAGGSIRGSGAGLGLPGLVLLLLHLADNHWTRRLHTGRLCWPGVPASVQSGNDL